MTISPALAPHFDTQNPAKVPALSATDRPKQRTRYSRQLMTECAGGAARPTAMAAEITSCVSLTAESRDLKCRSRAVRMDSRGRDCRAASGLRQAQGFGVRDARA